MKKEERCVNVVESLGSDSLKVSVPEFYSHVIRQEDTQSEKLIAHRLKLEDINEVFGRLTTGKAI